MCVVSLSLPGMVCWSQQAFPFIILKTSSGSHQISAPRQFLLYYSWRQLETDCSVRVWGFLVVVILIDLNLFKEKPYILLCDWSCIAILPVCMGWYKLENKLSFSSLRARHCTVMPSCRIYAMLIETRIKGWLRSHSCCHTVHIVTLLSLISAEKPCGKSYAHFPWNHSNPVSQHNKILGFTRQRLALNRI